MPFRHHQQLIHLLPIEGHAGSCHLCTQFLLLLHMLIFRCYDYIVRPKTILHLSLIHIYSYAFCGFRPVLEVLNPDTLGSGGLKVVTLDLNGGKLGGSSDAIQIIVKNGSGFTAPASDGMTRPDGNNGSYFMWLGSDGNLYAPGESVPEVVTTLTAQWTVNQYTITYDLAGGTVEGNPDTYTIETVAFTLKNPTKSGYTFTGWSGTGLDGENNMTVTIPKGSTGNRSYTAHWRYNGGGGSGYSYYTIKATAGAGGSISPSGNVSVREGRDQTFTITPDKDYAVANVKIDGKSIGAVKSYTCLLYTSRCV